MSKLVDSLFTHHPRSLGMSWAGHAVGAVKIGGQLIGAGAACLVHAVIPGLFTETAGRTITGMYDHMMRRRAGATNPNDWPEYEI
ncbi:MAG: DUF6356 family protein [Pseudomonadota bacterium]|nr:hypothetical protein [Sphingomonas sp.]MDQ3478637.1 DUF6356 family protein [Pseudomonadota bacterium]